MPTPPLTPTQLSDAIALVERYGSVTEAARQSGMAYGTVAHRYRIAKAAQTALVVPAAKDFDVAELPDELPAVEDLIARRKQQFARKAAAKDARKLIPVTVKTDGPIGIAHFGDPHVDDDGTDIGRLEQHVAICNKTDGLFAACVGDYSNNWIGRLARLYAEQSVSAREAWQLVEWLIGSTDWLYLVGGNHDAWSGAGDPIQWIAKQTGQRYETNGARLELRLPSGRTFRINARHEWPGHSMWNSAHGPSKAVQMGVHDHIVTCGHQHTSGYAVLRDPSTGLVSHAIRVAAYKIYDRYAEAKGLPDKHIFCCPVTIVDPQYPDDDVRAVTTLFDPGEAAEYLTWKRKRWARGQARAS